MRTGDPFRIHAGLRWGVANRPKLERRHDRNADCCKDDMNHTGAAAAARQSLHAGPAAPPAAPLPHSDQHMRGEDLHAAGRVPDRYD